MKQSIHKRLWTLLFVLISLGGILILNYPVIKTELFQPIMHYFGYNLDEPQDATPIFIDGFFSATTHQSALETAQIYIETMAFSYEGLVNQLIYEGYSKTDAIHVVNNMGVDWNEQAVKSTKLYLNYRAFSYKGLVEQLMHEGFTETQATYGASHSAIDWNHQALRCLEGYTQGSIEDKLSQLKREGFTPAQINHASVAIGY